MDKDTRNAIERATQRARKLLEEDFAVQLEGDFDVHRDGGVAANAGGHLSVRQAFQRERIVAAIEHKRAAGMSAADAARDYLRDAAFTTLNRFVALKMLEARDLVQECITKGEQSAGYREFCGLAAGVALLRESTGYRLYIESLFDELSTEVKVLFDRRDVSSMLWPKRATFEALLEIVNAAELCAIWTEDETVGWVYQFFNDPESRREMRESQAPRDSRELAVRNQFFTPQYVVRFLTDNTLGDLWCEMRGGESVLRERCEYLVVREYVPAESARRRKTDPRNLKIFDPACGSGHFLLGAFDLLEMIYEEAWADLDSPRFEATGKSLREDYSSFEDLRARIPVLVLEHNLWGVDIDPRCAQIAALALWMRAQKGFHRAEVARARRPQIRRTNICIAEALPRGEDREAFLSTLQPELRVVAQAVFERMELAGEAGSLLDIEDVIRSGIRSAFGGAGELFASVDEARWQRAEVAVNEALRSFTARARAGGLHRRRLFADDVEHGFAFIDAIRQRYDVVLMNPPFGDPTKAARAVSGPELEFGSNDLGAAFVHAAERRWIRNGRLGVLASTALWFKPTVAKWRETVLLSDANAIQLAAHLGGGVLDGATVSASAIVIDERLDAAPARFFRLIRSDQKDPALRDAVGSVRRAAGTSGVVFQVDVRALRAYRGCPLAYWISGELRKSLTAFPPLEPAAAEVRVGIQSSDDPRFVRAWWEIPAGRAGLSRAWAPLAKSSEYSPFWDDIHWALRWEGQGAEVRAFDKAKPQNMGYFGRAGVTFPGRSVLGFNPRAFPPDAAFSNMGSVAFPVAGLSAGALLGFLASRPLEYVLSFSNGALQGKKGVYPNHYEVGQIKDLPWPPFSVDELETLDGAGTALCSASMHLQDEEETTHQYAGRPLLGTYASIGDAIAGAFARRRELVAQAVRHRTTLDSIVGRALHFDATDLREMATEFAATEKPASGPWSPAYPPTDVSALREETEALLSEFVGMAFGRFDVRPAAGLITTPSPRNAFDPFPVTSAAELRAVPTPYPIDLPGDGILVDDPGHPRDIVAAVHRILEVIFETRAATIELELASLLGLHDLRSHFRDRGPRGFFATHIKRYSQSRRSAPIYWRLGVASGRYSVFLNVHSATPDVLFKLHQDYLVPRIRHEESKLDAARSEDHGGTQAQRRKEIAVHEELIEELRAFDAELKLLAPLWDCNPDDGVVINFAPLWPLVAHHKSWQKDLKSTWDGLCIGDNDWSHLAMHLWPERVVPKCATDRSLAIAHGLDEVFWVQGTNGKWTARKTPTRSVDELVRERTSLAVKSALKSLLEPPIAAGKSGGRRGGRRKSGAAAQGGDA